MTWFEAITGFPETSYAETKRRLAVDGGKLVGVEGKRYSVGSLEIPSLADLRQRTASGPARGKSLVTVVRGDVRELHAKGENAGALFQVASQFNLLEMVHYTVSPEEGVSRYESDRTQGPACAVAAGAATIFRNYLVPFPDGSTGQTRDRQIDALQVLGDALGNEANRFWRMKNGYTLFTEEGLRRVDEHLATASEQKLDELRSMLRVGVHWNVDVTDVEPGRAVSQVFCSAVPVSYNSEVRSRALWIRFASLVLEAAYEATLRAGLLNLASGKSKVVYLTRLGGGAFGNEAGWIHDAMKKAFGLAEQWGLDIRIVTYGKPDDELLRLAS